MTDDGMNKHEARKYLAAFADGELDVEQNLKVLEQMAMDPTNTRRVLHQQQLRKACAKAMDKPEHRCPDELRKQLLAMAEQPDVAGSITPAAVTAAGPERSEGPDHPLQASSPKPQASPSPVIARIGRWVPAAVAAVLFIGALSVFFSPNNTTGVSPLISEARLGQFTSRHKACAMDLSKLYEGIKSPTDVAALPGTLDDYFQGLGNTSGSIDANLDLSVLGYDFKQVGKCSLPGKDAVHVVYHAGNAPDPDHPQSISLWIKPDTGSLNIANGVLHTAESADGKPLLIWKRAGRVYYLAADMPDHARKAAEHLALDR